VTGPATDASLSPHSLQGVGHGSAHDYRAGSPHLRHWSLYNRLVSLLRDEIRIIEGNGLPLTVLEVGAGHGGYTEPALAAGCTVVATEMSHASVLTLTERYGLNPRFSALFDEDGSLSILGDDVFSLVVCASVLHHIPDYVSFVENAITRHLARGGSLITVQDPLWYPSLSPSDSYLTRLAYLSWRATRGDYIEGARTRLRRIRGFHDNRNPRDVVEYHVVRRGVDHSALLSVLRPRFDAVSLLPYWSTQSAVWQRVGERLGRANTFAILARSFRR